jgi:hypothetical protein
MGSDTSNIIPRTIVAPDVYVWSLQQAFHNAGGRLYETSFALGQDAAFDEALRRDPVALQAINDRLASVAGKAWTIQPASDDEDDKDLAAIVESALRRLRDFRSGRRNLAHAIFDGRSYAVVHGERRPVKLPPRGRKGTPRMANLWTPRRLQDVGAKRIRWGLLENGKPQLQYASIPSGQWIPVSPDVMLVSVCYDNREASLGYGRGLREGCYYYLYAKETALREGLQGLERWAQGMVVAKIDSKLAGFPTKEATQVAAEYLDTLKKHRGRFGGIAIDKADEIDVKWPAGTGQSMVTEFVRMMDEALTRLITGALLPSGGGSTNGSLARAEEEGSTIERVTQLDRDIVDEALTHDLIRRLVDVNRPQLSDMGLGDADYPRFETVMSQTEDPAKNATVVQTALQAGVALRKDEVYKKLGFTQPAEDDEVFDGVPPSPDAMLGSMDGAEERDARAKEAKSKKNGATKK